MKRREGQEGIPASTAAPERAARPGRRMGRRRFGAMALAAGASLAAPAVAQAAARVVVVGGGIGGATAARSLAEFGGRIDVVLVAERPTYTTPFFSNLYLAGFRSLSSITHRYDNLASRRGVRVVVSRALDVDRSGQRVVLQNGDSLPYDRLILAPGVSFSAAAVRGYDGRAEVAAPHGYSGGLQFYLLKRQLMEMRQGGVLLIAAPPDPSRCPTAPYERASMAALYFLRNNPTAKVVILDAKESFPQQRLFQAAWWKNYPGVIDWIPASKSGGGLASVDPSTLVASDRTGARIEADAVNVIPPQQAGTLAVRAGLVDRLGWAPVEPSSMRSSIDRRVFVVGDAARAGDMPKLASSAVSQARRAALSIAADLRRVAPPSPEYASRLWSFVGPQNVLKRDVVYRVDGGDIRAFSFDASASDDEPIERRDNALAANAWYAEITAGAFG